MKREPLHPNAPVEDESADPVGDGWSDAAFAQQAGDPSRRSRKPDRALERVPEERPPPIEPDRGHDTPNERVGENEADELEGGPPHGRQR